MWSRSALKEQAKISFKRNYWATVAVSVILMIVGGQLSSSISSIRDLGDMWSLSGYSGVSNLYSYNYDYGYGLDAANLVEDALRGIGVGTVFIGLGLLGMLLSILFTVLLVNPLKVGGNRFFMENREHKTDIGAMLYVFRSGQYGNVVMVMFMQSLFIWLWSLLLIVPGVIKAYEYRMVPYILSENPGMGYREALDLSKQMMDGSKLETFLLDLSFIGWSLLSALTCNILTVFYTNPYVQATNAELYSYLRMRELYNGKATGYQLPGFVNYQ